jgi:Nucleotidyl transferase AbiEii toxin, Type IV TA system
MLHTQTVEPLTLGLLKRLMRDEVLRPFSLVGGTALSLQIGHRKSVDLDLFSPNDFQALDILHHLAEIEGIKVDFIRFKYPFAEAIISTEGIRLANIKDIASMKIDAITGRGRKKDFCDLYFLLQRFSLTEIMEWYAHMYKHSTLFHVYKSLTWFEDADLDGNLDVLDKKFNWEKAKKTIATAVEKTI